MRHPRKSNCVMYSWTGEIGHCINMPSTLGHRSVHGKHCSKVAVFSNMTKVALVAKAIILLLGFYAWHCEVRSKCSVVIKAISSVSFPFIGQDFPWQNWVQFTPLLFPTVRQAIRRSQVCECWATYASAQKSGQGTVPQLLFVWSCSPPSAEYALIVKYQFWQPALPSYSLSVAVWPTARHWPDKYIVCT